MEGGGARGSSGKGIQAAAGGDARGGAGKGGGVVVLGRAALEEKKRHRGIERFVLGLDDSNGISVIKKKLNSTNSA